MRAVLIFCSACFWAWIVHEFIEIIQQGLAGRDV
jgi:hypothetical protein